MGKLFVIGNGFDLDHKIKTGYTDFLKYLQEDPKRSVFIENLEGIVSCYSHELWSSFEKHLGDLNLGILMETVMSEREDFNNQFDYGPLDESHLIRHVNEHRISSLHKLDEYVKGWVETIDLENVSSKSKYENIFTADSFFINFNYTNTLQEVYGISDEKVFHVHGDVTEPIMGHGMDTDDSEFPTFETDEIGINEFGTTIVSYVHEFYNNSKKDTELFCEQMISQLDHMTTEIDEVCIIGHSLGEVDAVYFRELSHYFQNIPWKIYSRYSDEHEVKIDRKSKLNILKQINNQLHADVVPYA